MYTKAEIWTILDFLNRARLVGILRASPLLTGLRTFAISGSGAEAGKAMEQHRRNENTLTIDMLRETHKMFDSNTKELSEARIKLGEEEPKEQ